MRAPAAKACPRSPEPASTCSRASSGVPMKFCTLLLVGAFVAVSSSAETMPAGLYEVITETGMPHLEENLRYTTTRENRCLTGEDLASAFPILKSASLSDCKLQHESRQGD